MRRVLIAIPSGFSLFIGIAIGLIVNKILFGFEIMVGTALLIILYLALKDKHK